MEKKKQGVWEEIKHHIPFTASATFFAIIFVVAIWLVYQTKTSALDEVFHVLHPLHILASSIVTAALYQRYRKNIYLSVIVGILGSILIGSISDIFLPFLGGQVLQLETVFHLPLIEEPLLIIGISALGSFTGILTGITRFPHFVHVFLSVFASIFYLLTFSTAITLASWIAIFLIVFIAVLIPCCISDILLPVWLARAKL